MWCKKSIKAKELTEDSIKHECFELWKFYTLHIQHIFAVWIFLSPTLRLRIESKMFLKQCLKTGIIKNLWVHIQDSSFKVGKPSWEQMFLKMPALIWNNSFLKVCYKGLLLGTNYNTQSIIWNKEWILNPGYMVKKKSVFGNMSFNTLLRKVQVKLCVFHVFLQFMFFVFCGFFLFCLFGSLFNIWKYFLYQLAN